MPTPIEITFTIVDRRSREATTSVKLGSSEVKSRVQLFAVAWANAIDNLIGGVIRNAIATLYPDISAITSNTATNDSDVEEILSCYFASSPQLRTEFNVPAILETLIINETGYADEAAPAIQALLTMMEDGIAVTGGNILPCDVGGVGPIENIYLRERSRNSGTRKKS